MNAGALAWAHTRVRAARGRLVDAQMLLRLRLAESPGSRAAALTELGLGDGSALDAHRVLVERLAADYARILRSLPGDLTPFYALRGRHEIENLKLVFRAVVRSHPESRWTPWWRPIGELSLRDLRHAHSFVEIAENAGPYRKLVETLPRELEPLELALDRYATRRIEEAPAEADLAPILQALVHERQSRNADSQRRRQLCARAFLKGPLSRAPAAALLLLEEDVLADVIARAEAV